ncbi:MAG: hypothetical protein WCW31_02960 [Patescibacteria group bacterium]|jgi:hypothetical protein
MKSIAFLGFLICLTLGCAYPKTYVIPAQTARNCDEIEHVISVRLPMITAPTGTKIFCANATQMVYAEKLDRSRIKVRYSDGKEMELDLPSGDEFPIGMVTYWLPEGKALGCGLFPSSPIGANGYIMWGEFTLFFKRVEQRKMSYVIREEEFILNYPLIPADRQLLREKSVPLEIANLLY